jgi:hypothetical protein
MKPIRTVAQRGGNDLWICQDKERPAADPKPKNLTVLPAPLLGDEMQACGVDLQEVAEDRQPAWARQIGNALHTGNPTMLRP